MIVGFSCTEKSGQIQQETKQKTENPGKSKEPVKLSKLDNPPKFKGGKETLFKYIRESVKYPEKLEGKNKEGSVVVGFVINKEGKVTDASVKRSSGVSAFDEEALRVVKEMPDWKPGKLEQEVVKVRYYLPIRFQKEDK